MKNQIITSIMLCVGVMGCAKGKGGGNSASPAAVTSGLRVLASNIVFDGTAEAASLTDDSGVDTTTKVLASNVMYAADPTATISATNVQDALVQTNLDPSKLIPGNTWSRQQLIAQKTGVYQFNTDGSYAATQAFALDGTLESGTFQFLGGVLVLSTTQVIADPTGAATTSVTPAGSTTPTTTTSSGACDPSKSECLNLDDSKGAPTQPTTTTLRILLTVLKSSPTSITLMNVTQNEVEVWTKQ